MIFLLAIQLSVFVLCLFCAISFVRITFRDLNFLKRAQNVLAKKQNNFRATNVTWMKNRGVQARHDGKCSTKEELRTITLCCGDRRTTSNLTLNTKEPIVCQASVPRPSDVNSRFPKVISRSTCADVYLQKRFSEAGLREYVFYR